MSLKNGSNNLTKKFIHRIDVKTTSYVHEVKRFDKNVSY